MSAKIFFLFIFFCGRIIFSQDTAFYFSARVLDAETRSPVPNAKISLIGTFRGVFTNEKGEFTILLGKKKSIVEVSAPFFFSSWFATPCLTDVNPTILLRAKSGGNKQNLIQKNPSEEKIINSEGWDLRDYDFYGKNILLLLHNKKTGQNKFIALSSGLKLIGEIGLKEDPISFFTDYDGGRNIIFAEKVKRFEWDEKKGISFERDLPIRKFEKTFYIFLASDSVNNYFKFDSPPEFFADENLNVKIKVPALTYYSVNRKTKQRSLLKNVSNEKSMKQEAGEKKYTELGLPRIPFNKLNAEYFSLKAPVFKTGNHICIFDMLNRKIENYDSTGKLLSPVSFYFYPEKFWNNDFYADAVTGKFYTSFFHIGSPLYFSLKEISLETGKTSSASSSVPEEFPSQVKVNDNFIYFLKRENTSGVSLIRIKITDK